MTGIPAITGHRLIKALKKLGFEVVSHAEKGETIRIISARKASKGERELYEE